MLRQNDCPYYIGNIVTILVLVMQHKIGNIVLHIDLSKLIKDPLIHKLTKTISEKSDL